MYSQEAVPHRRHLQDERGVLLPPPRHQRDRQGEHFSRAFSSFNFK
jgi:hypothetical protein